MLRLTQPLSVFVNVSDAVHVAAAGATDISVANTARKIVRAIGDDRRYTLRRTVR